jgi:phosphoribosyl-ATP pyrophosphohydrolase/phosphoribosyl-AMP cyclohydrolase
VIQHADGGEVLMVGYLDREALDHTLRTGLVHFHSRSRGALWKKGETSGNVLRVAWIDLDCDADAILVGAHPAGPTCHTGARSCFGRPGGTVLERLEDVITARRALAPGSTSYVRSLVDAGPARMAAKLTEEAAELGAELESGTRARLAAEAADLVFHALVALSSREVPLQVVLAELARRFGTSGIDEKDGRAGS